MQHEILYIFLLHFFIGQKNGKSGGQVSLWKTTCQMGDSHHNMIYGILCLSEISPNLHRQRLDGWMEARVETDCLRAVS